MDVTKLQFLDNPTLQALRAAFQIQDGRLFVQPFDVKLGETTMNVSGSNGLDQSLQYTLGLTVPRSLLGGGGEPGDRRPGVEGGRGGRRSQRGARDPARHPARRHGDESRRSRPTSSSLASSVKQGARAGGEAGGHAEGGLGGDAAGAGGGAEGGGDPAAGARRWRTR